MDAINKQKSALATREFCKKIGIRSISDLIGRKIKFSCEVEQNFREYFCTIGGVETIYAEHLSVIINLNKNTYQVKRGLYLHLAYSSKSDKWRIILKDKEWSTKKEGTAEVSFPKRFSLF